jgi:uncharacterized protein involved in exopolysaccharide biosynthesis
LGKAKSDLKRKQIGVDTLFKEIEDLKQKKNKIQNIKIVQQPTNSLYPIKAKKKLNVILAGVGGLFLMLFLMFTLEYIRKHKSGESQ